MSEVKTYSKGDFLFKENDKITHLYLIQSGGVNLCLVKEKKVIDLAQVGASQVLGEGALFGNLTHSSSAMATSETKVVLLPIELIKTQSESLPQVFKLLLKSQNERLKTFSQEIKAVRLEKNGIPCPEDSVPKLFASLYFALSHKGEKHKNSESVKIEWPNFKSYLHKVFNEQPKRVENAIYILKKLNLVELHYGPPPEDPDGAEVLLEVTFTKPSVLEAFFEFYQYFYFKSSRGDILKYDEFLAQILEILVLEGRDKPLDRFGSVKVNFQNVSEKIKQKLNITFGNDHFARLESKGVFCKRITFEDKPCIEFSYRELENILFSWRIIHEIDKWNLKGFVDLNEKKDDNNKKINDGSCPQCQQHVEPHHKFCANCGFKVEGLYKKAA